jgi:hypothetical protein
MNSTIKQNLITLMNNFGLSPSCYCGDLAFVITSMANECKPEDLSLIRDKLNGFIINDGLHSNAKLVLDIANSTEIKKDFDEILFIIKTIQCD